jgi:hypothetical protein
MLIRRAVCRPQDLIGATRMKIGAQHTERLVGVREHGGLII